MTTTEILSRFQGVKATGPNKWQARCPAHDDRSPSLSITETNGKILLHCFAGCQTEAIVSAAGLRMRDLFADAQAPQLNPLATFAAARGHDADAYRRLGCHGTGIMILFPMRDEDGTVVGERRRLATGEKFKSGKKALTSKGGRNGLIYDPDGLTDKILIVEGEVDAAAAMTAGYSSVIATPGATPGKEPFKYLAKLCADKKVILAPDPDDAGRKWREEIGNLLFNVDCDVHVIPAASGDLDSRLTDGETMDVLLETAIKWEPQTEPHTDKSRSDQLAGLYYGTHRKEYIARNERGAFLPRTGAQMKRLLKSRGYEAETAKGETLSEIDRLLLAIEEQKDIDYCGPLAGRDAGFYDENGVRFLVTQGPNVIEPVNGDWPIINALLTGMFDAEQLLYFFGWLSVGYRALVRRERMPGQALGIAGPADCYKSFVQKIIITGVLGGRTARPYQFMSGASDFNADLFRAEHLVIEDESASTDLRSRRHMGALIKGITVNEDQRCHGKGLDAIMLRPFWRLTLTMNDEPENLMVLPPMDDSLRDKLILLKAKMPERPMPTETLEQYKAFKDAVLAELPGFCFYLTQHEIAEEMKSHRFGVKEFHHPDILRELDASTPERRLLEMIDAEIVELHWYGTASELQRRLTDRDAEYSREARDLLHWYGAAGTYLGRLSKKHPGRFKQRRTGIERRWEINNEFESQGE